MKNLPNILKEAKATRERLDYEARINHRAQDMADPKNWREGDVVECISDYAGDGLSINKKYILRDECYRLTRGDVTLWRAKLAGDDDGYPNGNDASFFRWISR